MHFPVLKIQKMGVLFFLSFTDRSYGFKILNQTHTSVRKFSENNFPKNCYNFFKNLETSLEPSLEDFSSTITGPW